MTTFAISERPARRQTEGVGYGRQCETKGCFHSARYRVTFLDSYDFMLCSACAKSQKAAYEAALSNWVDQTYGEAS